MKITVFGTGYVGLVTGACLADSGHDVFCVDVDEDKVRRLKQGDVPIFEPGLDDLVSRNFQAGRLGFTTDAAEGVSHGLLQFIAVGTPPDEDGAADLQYVLQVATTIATYMPDYRVIVNKSTVPVGTAHKVEARVAAVLAERQQGIDFDVCSNPEFLKEGDAIRDFMQPDRIVVGTDSKKVRELMRECYQQANRDGDKLMFMDVRSAELTKYAANAMLATRISFMNEIANLAERLDADIEAVKRGLARDPRIGPLFLSAGCGYGGSCFPKDVQALALTGKQSGYSLQLLEAVEAVNYRQKQRLFEKLQTYFAQGLEGRTIAVWGLAFKPGTDDMREAPSRTLMERLWDAGAIVQAFDPVAMTEARRLYPDGGKLVLVESALDALKDADALVLCTEWPEFKEPDFYSIRDRLRTPFLIDGRNLYDPKAVTAAGLQYEGIGRKL